MKRHTAIAATIVTTLGLTLAGCADSADTSPEGTESAESAESTAETEGASVATESTEAAEETHNANDAEGSGEAPVEHSAKAKELIAAFKDHYPEAEETNLSELYAQMDEAKQEMPDEAEVKVDPPECDFSEKTDELDTLAAERSHGTLVSASLGGSEPAEGEMGIPPADATSLDLVVHDFANEQDAKTYLEGSDLYGGACSDITVSNGEGDDAFATHQTFEKSDLSLDGADDSFSGTTTMDGSFSQSGGMVYGRFGATVVTISASAQDEAKVRPALEEAIEAIR